jgi:putative ABC transport system permease protein
MFDLEKAIKQWRQELRKNEALEDGYKTELESHLRDEIENQLKQGRTEEEAFALALDTIGHADTIGGEYFKTDTRSLNGRPPWQSGSLMPDVLWNHIKIALRRLKRHKGYSFITIFGLAIGMACTILILIWVQDELSYDRFHNKSNQIYRITQVRGADRVKIAYTAAPTAEAMEDDFPEVLRATRLSLWPSNLLVSSGDEQYLETGFIQADPDIFDVFNIPFILGDPRTALAQPNNIVLTKDIAEKYFGEENPLGKILLVNKRREFLVTGVVENYPKNSHFDFDVIVPLFDNSTNWTDHSLFTYLVLQDNAPSSRLEAKFPDFILRHWGPQFEHETGQQLRDHLKIDENYYGFWLQPLEDIHLKSRNVIDNSKTKGDLRYIYIFTFIAGFILVIACINFINLSTARSVHRAKEVALRKVVGSQKSLLIRQFLVESVVMSCFAMVCALILVEMVLPSFNDLVGKKLSIGYTSDPRALAVLAGMALLTGLLAGLYPAFAISSFSPISILKGQLKSGTKGQMLRNILVVFQYTISIFILISTFVVYRQLTYLQNAKLGFDKDQVLVIQRGNHILQGKAFMQELLTHPNVMCVSNTSSLPGRHFNMNSYRLEGSPPSERYTLFSMYADHHFAELLGLEIVDGRFFSDKIASDVSSVVINETAVSRLGLKDPVGKRFHKEYGGAKEGEFTTIIGVVKDIHFHSLHDEITPMALRYREGTRGFYTSLKLKTGNIQETIKFVGNTWKKFSLGQPFEYSFLDEDFDNLYRGEKKTGQILFLFASLSIFVACLGIFGLASFFTEQRTKEIGIRKVLGASGSGIVLLLSKEFTKWIFVTNIFAWPIAYFAMNKWLQNFAYRTNIGPWIFVLSGLLVFVIALVTVSYQSIKAALSNPVDSLRYE